MLLWNRIRVASSETPYPCLWIKAAANPAYDRRYFFTSRCTIPQLTHNVKGQLVSALRRTRVLHRQSFIPLAVQASPDCPGLRSLERPSSSTSSKTMKTFLHCSVPLIAQNQTARLHQAPRLETPTRIHKSCQATRDHLTFSIPEHQYKHNCQSFNLFLKQSPHKKVATIHVDVGWCPMVTVLPLIKWTFRCLRMKTISPAIQNVPRSYLTASSKSTRCSYGGTRRSGETDTTFAPSAGMHCCPPKMSKSPTFQTSPPIPA